MNENKTQLVLAFVVTGAVLIGLGFFLTKKSRNLPANPVRLASVQLQSGQAFTVRSGYAQREKISGKQQLFNLDSVESAEASEALLNFESAYRVTLLENTLVTLEQIRSEQSEHIVLILKRGEIRIENFGREGTLFIAKNGERVPAPEYNGSKLASAPVLTEEVTETTLPTETLQGLSADEIAATMAQNKGTLFKCYTQSLQKNSSYKGDVSISFTIENNGRVSAADISSSQIDDADFKACLIDIVKRIEFKPFTGTPISTMSPIRFE
jgi:hypothetical protein